MSSIENPFVEKTTFKVLVVEDEHLVSDFIAKALKEYGYEVFVASDGQMGLDELVSGKYDVAILDIMMPKLDGFEVMEAAKKMGSQTPILMLSARGAVEDRIRGLDTGADDYLAKPFELNELIARLRALIRRRPTNLSWLSVGHLSLDPVTRTVNRSGKRVDLTAREFSLLELFMRNYGVPLTRQQIMEVVWDDPRADSNVIPVYINYLRVKIEQSGQPRLIHTVRGTGYILEIRDGKTNRPSA